MSFKCLQWWENILSYVEWIEKFQKDSEIASNAVRSKKIVFVVIANIDRQVYWTRIEFDFDEFCLFSNDNEILMFFYVNDIVFAFTASRKKNAENLIRRLKDIFDMRNLDSLNFFLDVRILQKLDTIWLIQNFYMNKLIKNYVINIEYKTTTLLSYQSLMSYIDEMNQEKVHVYRQKMRSIYYFVIIIRSNIIKIASELTRHFINSDSKHLKTTDHCIKYLHVIKFLIMRYSNSKSEKLSNQISSSNKEKSNKKMSSTSNSKLNKKRHR
jgi:hypothetical protein